MLRDRDRTRREIVRDALGRAEKDLPPVDLYSAVGISKQRYTNFRRSLYLSDAGVQKLTAWLIKHRYLAPDAFSWLDAEPTPIDPLQTLANYSCPSAILAAELRRAADTLDNPLVDESTRVEWYCRRVEEWAEAIPSVRKAMKKKRKRLDYGQRGKRE